MANVPNFVSKICLNKFSIVVDFLVQTRYYKYAVQTCSNKFNANNGYAAKAAERERLWESIKTIQLSC